MHLAMSGRMALITAGASEISVACARSLLSEGYSVTLMGSDLDELIAVRAQLATLQSVGAAIELFAGDALEKDDVLAAIELAASIHNRLDVCVANVRCGNVRPLLLHDISSFKGEIDSNVLSAFLLVRYSVECMAATGGGSIVCLSSVAEKKRFH
jgi:NAD(P)-dependent dehydrogenase (short-subunit alcohol dehydrogenase family)